MLSADKRFIDWSENPLRLWVHDRSVGDQKLFELLTNGEDLACLMISHAQITSDGLTPVTDLSKLLVLEIEYCPIDDAAMPIIAELANSLTTLAIRSCPISNGGLEKISDLPLLKTLYLEATNVTNDGLPSLARLPQLMEVSLRQSLITVASPRSLN